MSTQQHEEGSRSPRGITLCMINYNGRAFIEETLSAALERRAQVDEVIFVDNGSQDGSAEFVATRFPEVRVVALVDNGGPGAARNAGFREARSDLVLFLDNDVTLLEGCIPTLVSALKADTDAVVAMPTVIYAHRPDTVQYAGAGSHFLGLMVLHEQDRPVTSVRGSPRRVTSVVTCCFLADRTRLHESEPFDEVYFYQMEDHDFGVRLHAEGFAILAVPGAQVRHGHGTAGMSIRQTGGYAPIRVYCLIRNRWIFLAKHYSSRSLVILAPMLLVYELAQLIIALKKGWMREWYRSLVWLRRNRRLLAEKRRQVGAARRRPQGELFIGGKLPLRDEVASGRLEASARALLDGMAIGYWRVVSRVL